MSKITEIKERFAQARKTMESEGEAAMKEVFADFFKKHPEVNSVKWVQYTPYFNDGDSCTFGVGESEVKANLDELEPDVKEKTLKYSDEDSYNYGEGCLISVLKDIGVTTKWNEKTRDLTENEQSIIDDWEHVDEIFGLEDVLLGTFGDHSMITATAKGFDVEVYDHE